MRVSLPRGPRKNDLYSVQIEHIAPGGMGVGYLHANIGPQQEPRTYALHVRKAVPGDTISAHVEQNRKGILTCRIESIEIPAKTRQTPRCQHFGLRNVPNKGCGGCTLQSISYEAQLESKVDMVRRLFANRGMDNVTLRPAIGMADPWYFRNKMEFSFGDYDEKGFSLGLHPTGFKHDVIDLKSCYTLSERALEILDIVRLWAARHDLKPYKPRENSGFLRTLTVREGKHTGQCLVAVTTTPGQTTLVNGQETDVASLMADFVASLAPLELDSIYWIEHRAMRGQPTTFIDHHLEGRPTLLETLYLPNDKQLSFEIHPRAFFQPNTQQAQVLYSEILKLSGLLDNPSGYVLDLYCGTGTIALCMAAYCRRVVGIEMNPQAVENALGNAKLNQVEQVEFHTGDVGKVLLSDALDLENVDMIIVDPPRAGLFPLAIEQIQRTNVPKIVYVSCNPESLARDVLRLSKIGYELQFIQPVDLFPHTHHIENIAIFTMK